MHVIGVRRPMSITAVPNPSEASDAQIPGNPNLIIPYILYMHLYNFITLCISIYIYIGIILYAIMYVCIYKPSQPCKPLNPNCSPKGVHP